MYVETDFLSGGSSHERPVEFPVELSRPGLNPHRGRRCHLELAASAIASAAISTAVWVGSFAGQWHACMGTTPRQLPEDGQLQPSAVRARQRPPRGRRAAPGGGRTAGRADGVVRAAELL